MPSEVLPKHIAVIMDGNGRWAKRRLLPRIEGHRNGAKTVRMMVEECRRIGIKVLTLFAFSTENWGRPADEVGSLMKLFVQYLRKELDLLKKHDIRLRSIGDRSKLSAEVLAELEGCEQATKNNGSMDLVLALSYGGRQEIVAAAQQLALRVRRGEIEPAQIDERLFGAALYAPDIPDPDLLIRTSNECRVSNFLLWQLAYTEIVVVPELWPEFSKETLQRCLDEYAGRSRRYGLTTEE